MLWLLLMHRRFCMKWNILAINLKVTSFYALIECSNACFSQILIFLVYHFHNFSDDNSFFMYKKQPLLTTSLCTFSPIILIDNVIQSTCKVTQVTPVRKSGPENVCTNYRPISVLSPLNKIFEKLLYDRLYHYVECKNMLSKHQYGFRAKVTTEFAIYDIVVNVWLPCPCHVVASAILQSLVVPLYSPRGCCVVLAVS